MRGFNEVRLLGNLGKDPVTRTSANGNLVCFMSVATNRRFYHSQEGWKDDTQWHTIVAFRDTGENCQKNLRKGSRVFVTGWIRNGKRNDVPFSEVIVEDIIFLDSQPREEQPGEEPDSVDQENGDGFKDDIPY